MKVLGQWSKEQIFVKNEIKFFIPYYEIFQNISVAVKCM